MRWKGFLDKDRVILGGQIVGTAFFLSVWLTKRSKARAAMKALGDAGSRRGKKKRLKAGVS